MALSITDHCVSCYACLDVCPSKAISKTSHSGAQHFKIDPKACNECVGHYAESQCASICPVEQALLDSQGNIIHPPGALSGVSTRLHVVTHAETAST